MLGCQHLSGGESAFIGHRGDGAGRGDTSGGVATGRHVECHHPGALDEQVGDALHGSRIGDGAKPLAQRPDGVAAIEGARMGGEAGRGNEVDQHPGHDLVGERL